MVTDGSLEGKEVSTPRPGAVVLLMACSTMRKLGINIVGQSAVRPASAVRREMVAMEH